MRISTDIYNHLSSNLVPKKRNTTHKSSELKDIYNRMARYNKNSPLFLLSMSDEKVNRMVDIKEAAITLKDAADIFADTDNPIYKKKLFYSADESSISGSIKGNDLSNIPEELSVSVKSLATEQVNTGNYLDKNSLDIPSGRYSFTIELPGGSSEYNFLVDPTDTNYDIQQKIVYSINSKSSDLRASIVDDGKNSAIMLSSKETGVIGTADGLTFSLAKDETSSLINDIFGLDNVSVMPSNSTFTINGVPHTSTSNSISINQILELDFHKVTDSEIKIGLLPDTSGLKKEIGAFVDAYNGLVDLGSKDKGSLGRSDLLSDISGIVRKHMTELEHAGIAVDETGHLIRDTKAAATTSTDISELFNRMSSFKADVDATAEKLSLDPMAYINKLIVTYPNAKNKFSSTYTQSLYSGLMYNNYA